MVRLLVVDRSELLAWRISRIVPPDVEVESVNTLAAARRRLRENPPDAAIFDLCRCHSDWEALFEACSSHDHPIPFLCVAEVDHFEACGRELPCRQEELISEGLPREELGRKIAGLFAGGGDRHSCPQPGSDRSSN